MSEKWEKPKMVDLEEVTELEIEEIKESIIEVLYEPQHRLLEPSFCGFCGQFCTPIFKPR